MIYVSTGEIAGKKIVKTFGLVRGNTIRARHVGRDILAAFKNLVGGEIDDYSVAVEITETEETQKTASTSTEIEAFSVVQQWL